MSIYSNGSIEGTTAEPGSSGDKMTMDDEDELAELKERPKDGFGFPGSVYEEEFDWMPVYALLVLLGLLILLWCIYTIFIYVPPVSSLSS